MITHTFTGGDYKAEVNDDFTVAVYLNDNLIDRPGPWGDHEGARQWAELIVNKYHADEL